MIKIANREGPKVNRQSREPKPQAARDEPSQADYQTYAEELSSFQRGWAVVSLWGEPILVSRRTLSEIADTEEPLTIIHNWTENNEDGKNIERKVLVMFDRKNKTYRILTYPRLLQFANNSPIEIDPTAEQGKAWIQCLQEAYPYFDFENAKIKPDYPLPLPKVIDRQNDQLSLFNSETGTFLHYYSTDEEELNITIPRLHWFDPYTYTYYTLLFDPKSSKYVLIYRYRKERFLYIVTIKIQAIDANAGHVSFVKTITKQTQTLEPKSSSVKKARAAKGNDQIQKTKQNQVPKIPPNVLNSLVETINVVLKIKFNLTDTKEYKQFVQAVIDQMVKTLSTETILANYLNQVYIERFTEKNKTQILDRLFPRKSTSETTTEVSTKGNHPELIKLIKLLHQVYPNYQFPERLA